MFQVDSKVELSLGCDSNKLSSDCLQDVPVLFCTRRLDPQNHTTG